MRIITLLTASALLALVGGVEALAAPATILEGAQLVDGNGSLELLVSFARPMRYLRHTPAGESEAVAIDFGFVGAADPFDVRGEAETLPAPRQPRSPVESIELDPSPGGARIEVRFVRRAVFEVIPGADLRSVAIRFPAAPVSEVDGRAGELVREGRAAFTSGDFQRAALIFGQAARMPDNAHSAEAREYLGLARERTGQLAHAKAEYEAYLERYPDGEGAERVRQRLAALTTARALPKGPLRVDPEARPRLDIRTAGSLYVSYRRAELFADGGQSLLIDNSILSDVHLDTRVRRRGFELRSQIAASYWHGFLDDGSDGKARIYSAFVEAGNPSRGLSGSLGRRSASDRGVIGRYDGVQVSYPVGERWELGALAGFPLDSSAVDDFDPDRQVAGLNLAARGLFGLVDADLFLVGQRDAGFTDRIAVGGEFRYFDDGRMLAGFLDFDAYYQSLNVAQLIGSWQIDPRTFVTGTIDHRNVPILTTRNAVIGQPAGSLDDLGGLFGDAEIEQLAEDRTATATTLSLNASYELTPTLQVSGDFVASRLSGTETSGGVAGISSTGFDFGFVARLVANELLADDDVSVWTLRYYDGSSSDVVATTFDAHYYLSRDVRLNPRLLADLRLNDLGSDQLRVIPSLRSDWRVLGFRLEGEVGFEWWQPLGAMGERQLGYFTMLGVRYDF